MNESFPHFFFLKTENVQPLIILVNKLNKKIEKNQKIINRLTNLIDINLKFPDQINSIDIEDHNSNDDIELNFYNENNDNNDNNDNEKKINDNSIINELPLTNLLNKKYQFDKIKPTKDYNHIKNPKIKQLLIDNDKLKTLKKINNFKNHELLKIYQDYEFFIIEKILPNLRNDIFDYNKSCIEKISKINYQDKESLNNEIWQRYNYFINCLFNLFKLCNQVLELINQDLTNDEIKHFNSNLLIINNLIEYLK